MNIADLSLDESGQFGPGAGLGVRDEASRMLLHQAVQRSLFGAVAFIVERGAIRCPLGLPADGLRARLPSLEPRTVSGRAPCLNRLECCPPLYASAAGPPRGDCGGVRPAASGRRDQDSGCRLRVVGCRPGEAGERPVTTQLPTFATCPATLSS